MGYRVILFGRRGTGDDDIGVPLESHVDAAVLNLAGDGAGGVEVCEGVAFLFGEGVNCLDAGEFGGGELGEAGLGLDLLLLYHLDLLVGAALLEGHGLGGNGLCGWLHLSL